MPRIKIGQNILDEVTVIQVEDADNEGNYIDFVFGSSGDCDYVDIQDTIDFLNSMGLDTTTDLLPAVTNESYVGAAILSE